MHTRIKSGTGNAILPLAAALLTVMASGQVLADKPGYLLATPERNVVRSGFGECVHTGSWTPGMEVPVECGGQVAAAEPVEPPAEQAAFEPPKPTVHLETLTLDASTLFAFDKAELRPEARQELDALAERMRDQTAVLSIKVSGHADRIGDDEYNLQLSEKRARAVADYLNNHTDLNRAKFEVQGMGETQPVVQCDNTPAGQSLINCLQPNRRVEVEVTAQQQVTRN